MVQELGKGEERKFALNHKDVGILGSNHFITIHCAPIKIMGQRP